LLNVKFARYAFLAQQQKNYGKKNYDIQDLPSTIAKQS